MELPDIQIETYEQGISLVNEAFKDRAYLYSSIPESAIKDKVLADLKIYFERDNMTYSLMYIKYHENSFNLYTKRIFINKSE